MISKCCNYSMDYVLGVSALVTRYLMIKPPNTRGHIPLLATPSCIFWIVGGAEKVVTFLNNIFQTKTSVGA
jgi:hypothetical protein